MMIKKIIEFIKNLFLKKENFEYMSEPKRKDEPLGITDEQLKMFYKKDKQDNDISH